MDELSEYTYRRIDLGKPAIRLIRLLRGVFSVDIIRYELFDPLTSISKTNQISIPP